MDLDLKQGYMLSSAERGFIVPQTFENDKLIYTKEYDQPGIIKEFELEFLFVDSWDNIK
jgi:hypothetical protein